MGSPVDPNQHDSNSEDEVTAGPAGDDERTQFVPPQASQPGQPPMPPPAGGPPGYDHQWQQWQGPQYPVQQYPPAPQAAGWQQPYPGQSYPSQPYPGQQHPAPPPVGGYAATGFGGGTPPPGMPPAPGGYPGFPGGPGQPPQPPQPSKQKWLLGAGAVVIVIVVIAVIGMWAGGVFNSDEDGGPTPSASARELVLERSGFPSMSNAKYRVVSSDNSSTSPSTSSSSDDDYHETFDPADCELLASPGHTQDGTADQASASLYSFDDDSALAYRAAVEKAIDPVFARFNKLLSSCSTFTVTSVSTYSGETSTTVVHGTANKLSVSGVQGAYYGIEMTSKGNDSDSGTYRLRMLLGKTRGVSLMVSATAASAFDSAVNTNLVKMFNAQRDRIDNAS